MADFKDSFILYAGSVEQDLELLDDIQTAALFRALVSYGKTREVPPIDDKLVKMAFNHAREGIDRNNDKYEAKTEARRAAGKAGMEKRWGNGNKNSFVTEDITNDKKNSFVMNGITNDNKNNLQDKDKDKDKDKDSVKDSVKDRDDNTGIIKRQERDKNISLVGQIVDRLNKRCGTHYKPTTAETVKHINARLKEGFCLEDFFTVIDKKADEWIGTEYEKYLRPDTLFNPSKFEGYLNQRAKPKREDGINAFLGKGADDG